MDGERETFERRKTRTYTERRTQSDREMERNRDRDRERERLLGIILQEFGLDPNGHAASEIDHTRAHPNKCTWTHTHTLY